jgi:aspartyl/asparaginyl-tRNA synthetase
VWLCVQMADACRQELSGRDPEEKEGEEAPPGVVTKFTRLNYRWIDLRTPANQGIMRISSMVCTLFREFLLT